jgi:hypothetical protein
VSASAGLRGPEQKRSLSQDHWLVQQVIDWQRPVVLTGSDLTRTRMDNAPLARRPHLMAVPIAGANALILLARDTDGFDEQDVAAVVEAADEATPPLVAALAEHRRRLPHPPGRHDIAGAPGRHQQRMESR